MNLKISKAATGLTSPSIPLQHCPTEALVGFGRKPPTGMFGSDRIHEARWESCDLRESGATSEVLPLNRSISSGRVLPKG